MKFAKPLLQSSFATIALLATATISPANANMTGQPIGFGFGHHAVPFAATTPGFGIVCFRAPCPAGFGFHPGNTGPIGFNLYGYGAPTAILTPAWGIHGGSASAAHGRPVRCMISGVAALTLSVDDCEKAGGEVAEKQSAPTERKPTNKAQ